jgi:hypothetical protein
VPESVNDPTVAKPWPPARMKLPVLELILARLVNEELGPLSVTVAPSPMVDRFVGEAKVRVDWTVGDPATDQVPV